MRKRNKQAAAEYQRRYRRVNREKVNATNRAWRAANPERAAAHARRYRQANLPLVRERQREYARAQKNLPGPSRPVPPCCEACGIPQKTALRLDHCHVTGKFRGWLCNDCNLGIGLLGDTVESLELRLAYLRRAA